MAKDQAAAEQAGSDVMGPRRDSVATVRDQGSQALTVGTDPAAPQADPVVAGFTARYTHLLGRPDGVELRRRPATRLESANNPSRDRYLQLLAVVNGWPVTESPAPVFDWPVEALRPDGHSNDEP
ncbi:hypothetical protein [Streptomyces stramineus]